MRWVYNTILIVLNSSWKILIVLFLEIHQWWKHLQTSPLLDTKCVSSSILALLTNRRPVYLGQLLRVREDGQLVSGVRLYAGSLHGSGKDSAGNDAHFSLSASTNLVLLWPHPKQNTQSCLCLCIETQNNSSTYSMPSEKHCNMECLHCFSASRTHSLMVYMAYVYIRIYAIPLLETTLGGKKYIRTHISASSDVSKKSVSCSSTLSIINCTLNDINFSCRL